MARSLNGSSDLLSFATAPVTAAPLTMVCWFNAVSAVTTGELVCLTDTATNNTELFRLEKRSTGTLQAGTNHTTAAASTTSTTYSASVWNHAAAVFTSSASRSCYLNGGGNVTDTTSIVPTSIDTIAIGARKTSATSIFYSGSICEVGVWDVALSAGEIAALARGVCPLRIRTPVFYAPIWGSSSPERDYTVGQRHCTVTGTTVAAHAPVQPLAA